MTQKGSPIGRSSSPTDIIGSPHSPAGNGVVGSCPQYPDAMALAGPNYQHFMDLTKDVQKLSVVRENLRPTVLEFSFYALLYYSSKLPKTFHPYYFHFFLFCFIHIWTKSFTCMGSHNGFFSIFPLVNVYIPLDTAALLDTDKLMGDVQYLVTTIVMTILFSCFISQFFS